MSQLDLCYRFILVDGLNLVARHFLDHYVPIYFNPALLDYIYYIGVSELVDISICGILYYILDVILGGRRSNSGISGVFNSIFKKSSGDPAHGLHDRIFLSMLFCFKAHIAFYLSSGSWRVGWKSYSPYFACRVVAAISGLYYSARTHIDWN